ncbi:MAG: hypothetical protein NC432_11940 [Roseburia sp.]|nr:hypothetical protein [Roseburia sp.]MCM1099527.1 hypothetical protein [Ruminococcus flavefaciens]
MNHTTSEQKLRLIQQIRSRYRENRYDLYNREKILYGRADYPSYEEFPEEEGEGTDPEAPVSGFRVRLFLAAFLFAALVAMDINDVRIAGITADTVMEAISADYESRIDQWIETLSDTAMPSAADAKETQSQSTPQR